MASIFCDGAQSAEMTMGWVAGDHIWRMNDLVTHPCLPSAGGIVREIKGKTAMRPLIGPSVLCVTYRVEFN